MGLTRLIKLVRFLCSLHFFGFSKWLPSAILDFNFFRNFCQKFKLSLISTSTCNIWWRSDDPRPSYLRIFDLQNGGRPPSWIWYDVVADHSQLVFDGPNIVLKLYVDRVCTLQDIAIFIFDPFGLKLPIHAPFWGVLGDITPKWIPILSQPPKGPSLGENTSNEP